MSKKEKRLLVFAAVLVTVGLCLLWRPGAGQVLADWVDQPIDGASEYSKYPLENYKLEIMLEGWGFSKIGKWILNMLANMIFSLNNMFSYFVGWVIDQAYQVDFIGEAIDFLSGNIQAIAGVDAGGFRTSGLFPSLAPYLILCAAVYFVWVGIFKRRAVQAAVNLGAFCIIFVLGMGFVAYSGSYLHMVNDFQKDFNEEIMEISSQITLGGSGGDMVDQMRENTFVIMVKNPYLMFNYGTSDVEAIGEERINELLEAPVGSDEREDLVEQEYDDLDNTYMGEEHLAERLGMCLVVLVVNLIVGICILLFSAMLIMAQVMFVLYMSFFPVALVFSLFPNSGGRLKKILGKSLDTILMRPGISLILTVVFSISMLCYQLAGTGNYLWTMFLQGVTFVVAIMKTGEFLGYMKVGSDRGDEKSVMRYIVGGLGARAALTGARNFIGRTAGNVLSGAATGVKTGAGTVVKGAGWTARTAGRSIARDVSDLKQGSQQMREYKLKNAAMQEDVFSGSPQGGQSGESAVSSRSPGNRRKSVSAGKSERKMSGESVQVRRQPGGSHTDKMEGYKYQEDSHKRRPGAPIRAGKESGYQTWRDSGHVSQGRKGSGQRQEHTQNTDLRLTPGKGISIKENRKERGE